MLGALEVRRPDGTVVDCREWRTGKTLDLLRILALRLDWPTPVGVLIGVLWPDFATGLKVLSDGFLKLITMIVAPIVFCVVVHGIAGAGDLKKVGRVGVKALVYFEVMTTVALVSGCCSPTCSGPAMA